MPSPLSVDLRERVVAAVVDGASMQNVADRFGVSASSASRWSATARETGDVAPKPCGGDQRSHAIEAHANTILALHEAHTSESLERKIACPAVAEWAKRLAWQELRVRSVATETAPTESLSQRSGK